MANQIKNRPVGGRIGRRLTSGVALLAFTAMAGCSQVPDAANPIEWYSSTVEFFAGEDQPDTKAPPGSDQPFPSLSSVDQQQAAQDNRSSGLVADPNAPQYAEAIARQGEAQSVLQTQAPAAPPTPGATASVTPGVAPTPPAMPVPTVSTAQLPGLTPNLEPSAPPAVPSEPVIIASAEQVAAEHQEFSARLSRQLAEIQARAGLPTSMPASTGTVQPMPDSGMPTVVVTSGGVLAADIFVPAAQPVATVSSSGAAFGEIPAESRATTRLSDNAVKVATIMFPNGSSHLSARDRRILANIRKLHKERGGRLRVIGHASSRTRNTDPVRHKMVNFKVSVDRADAVARELMRMGIKRDLITVDAVSDTEPVYFEFMPSGEAGNRRTEIYLEG